MYIIPVCVYAKYISLMQAENYKENVHLWYWKY